MFNQEAYIFCSGSTLIFDLSQFFLENTLSFITIVNRVSVFIFSASDEFQTKSQQFLACLALFSIYIGLSFHFLSFAYQEIFALSNVFLKNINSGLALSYDQIFLLVAIQRNASRRLISVRVEMRIPRILKTSFFKDMCGNVALKVAKLAAKCQS